MLIEIRGVESSVGAIARTVPSRPQRKTISTSSQILERFRQEDPLPSGVRAPHS
jgi:hypothetical protein